MTRLSVFLLVLVGFVLVLVLNANKDLTVDHAKFDYVKNKEAYDTHAEAVEKALEPKEEVAVDADSAPAEEEIKVDLNTPQLVSGSKVYSKCIACHGKGGAGIAAQKAPHIGGQYDWYIEKQLTDMKAGTRVNVAMNPTLKGLSDQDMKDVAAYVSKLPWKKAVAAAPKK
jgi:cytochrome c553